MMVKKQTQIKIVLFFIVVVLIYNHFFYNSYIEPSVIKRELDDLQKETLSTLNEMSKLLISLSTALFGLVGYFILESFKSKGTIKEDIKMEAVLSFSFAALSIDFGYLFMEKWAEMLAMGVFSPFDRMVILPQRLQITTFLFSLLFSGKLIYKSLLKNT